MHSILGMNNIPHKDASAWDLRTEVREECELPRHLGKSLDMESSLVGKELDNSQLHKSNSLESLPLVRRKSGSADSIPSLVHYAEFGGDFPLASNGCDHKTSITKLNRRAARCKPSLFLPDRGIHRFDEGHYHISKEWKQHRIRRYHKQQRSPNLLEKLKKHQVQPRGSKVADYIMAELIPSVAKMTCRDPEEETSTPGHF